MSAEQATQALQQMARAFSGDPKRTISGAKGAYIRGDIDADQLEQRVQDILDGTAERRHRERVERHCDETGCVWMIRCPPTAPSATDRTPTDLSTRHLARTPRPPSESVKPVTRPGRPLVRPGETFEEVAHG